VCAGRCEERVWYAERTPRRYSKGFTGSSFLCIMALRGAFLVHNAGALAVGKKSSLRVYVRKAFEAECTAKAKSRVLGEQEKELLM
jgi:hypothetical protein